MPADKLTYGGVPLLFDRQGRAQDFIDRFQPLEELALHGPHIATLGSRTSSYGPTGQIGLPLPNYPAYPRPRVNDLYWPTGAARWAIGYFLVDTAGQERILALQGPQALKANDGTTSGEWEMYALTSVPVSCPDGGNNLWLLVLVDARWFWQWISAGEPTTTSWTAYVSGLASRIGITLTTDTIDADYLIPDDPELARQYDNAALLLDAAAHSIGHRIIHGFDGAVGSINAATSEARYLANIAAGGRLAAGGAMPVIVPAALEVAFPRMAGCCWTGEYYLVTEQATSHVATGTSTAAGFTKTIHDTAWAAGETGTPTNSSTLATLASQIASDYYDHLTRRYDRTLIGIKEWLLTGYDDAVTFSFGQLLEGTPRPASTLDGEVIRATLERQFQPRYFTRVRTLPLNFGVDQLCHQDSSLDLPTRPPGCEDFWGVLTATLSEGGSATAEEINNANEYTGISRTVYDFFQNSGGTHASGTKIKARWRCDRYVVTQVWCAASDTLPAAMFSSESGSPMATESGDVLTLES